MGRRRKETRDQHAQKVIYFSLERESNLLEWLNKRVNQSAYIKALIRADLETEKYRNKERKTKKAKETTENKETTEA